MPEFRNIGGQAVIEGVLMRSPLRYAVAVRRPDGTIGVMRRDYVPLSARNRFWRMPFIRGVVLLIESLAIGMKALSYSAEEAMQEEEKAKQRAKRSGRRAFWERAGLGLTMAFAFVFGMGLFFWLPLQLSHLTTGALGVESGIVFNLIDGVFRLVIFLAYLWLISRWKEIQRIFQYHGAEHKSIFTYERDGALEPEVAAGHERFHPRCGTSFLLLVVLLSVVVFIILGRPDSIGEKFLRFLFVPVIGGIAYEFLRLAGRRPDSALLRPLIAPGLWLQRITTNEPSEDQLEVALVALKEVLQDAQDAEHRELVAEI